MDIDLMPKLPDGMTSDDILRRIKALEEGQREIQVILQQMLGTQRELFKSLKLTAKSSNDNLTSLSQSLSRLVDVVSKKDDPVSKKDDPE